MAEGLELCSPQRGRGEKGACRGSEGVIQSGGTAPHCVRRASRAECGGGSESGGGEGPL